MLTISTIVITVLLVSLLVITFKYLQLKSLFQKAESELTHLQDEHAEITRETAHQEAVPHDALDALTGLPNRMVFEDRLTQAINQSKRRQALFAVMALNVDNLSEIRQISEEVQDQLLSDLGRRLQMSIRQVDTLSRFADGYFLFLLPHLSRPETAIYVAQRIQDNLMQSFKIKEHDLFLNVSMGISIHPIDGETKESLLKSADSAMHQAKNSGKNQYQFSQPELHNLGQRELNIAHLIRGENLFKSLQVLYKPFFNPQTNEPIYIQATAHMHHPKLGMVSFTEFGQIAENSGKMLDINEWLLKKALEQLEKWYQENFKPEYIAITASLKQLENPHFIYKLIEIKNQSRIENLKFVLEISDDSMPQNPVYLEKLFNMLNEADIKVSVGVISLARFATQKINKIPLSYLKIDSRLLKEAGIHSEKEDILNKIIALAKDENIIVMAEGVDTEKQKQRLQILGCELMEGKLFGYLMPTGSVLELES